MCRRLLQLLGAACSERRRRRVKRYLSYFVIVCNYFLGGFEYGVIFPTAMDYLLSLGATGGRETSLFGLLIFSYASANIVGGYVGGLWADMFIQTRPLLVIAAVPQIVGNALYFFAASPADAISAHALSGLGSGVNTAMMAELTRTTSLKHRTGVIGVITFARQLGIVCGPAVGAYLTGMPDVFRHRVSLLNAPGLLLMLCYMVYMLLLTLLYSNLTVDKDESGGAPSAGHPALMAVGTSSAGSTAAVSRHCSGQSTSDGALPRDTPGSPDTSDRTPERQPCAAAPQGPTPHNTPQPAAGAAVHTPQRPLVLSLPQPSPSQCSSWPPYRSLGPTPEDVEDGPEVKPCAVTASDKPLVVPEPPPLACALPPGWPNVPDHRTRLQCHCPHLEHCSAKPLSWSQLCLPGRSSPPPPPAVSVVREWRELLCWPVAALLACNLAAYMTQTSLEAVLPALVERDLGLPIDATGRIFIAGGLVQCAVLVCIFVTPLLPSLRDQRLIVTGLLVMVAAHVHLLATLCLLRDSAGVAGEHVVGPPSPSPLPSRDPRWFWVVLAGSGVQFFGYPLVNSVACSFMSKMLSRGAQGVGAAGLRLSMCTGLMLGPVWGSGMLHYQLPLLLLPLAVLLGSLLAFCWFERRGEFSERMRQAAVVDTVTPRVCTAPRRVRTISALSHIRGAAGGGASSDPLGGASSDSSSVTGKRRRFD